jgi:hypothetical protein
MRALRTRVLVAIAAIAAGAVTAMAVAQSSAGVTPAQTGTTGTTTGTTTDEYTTPSTDTTGTGTDDYYTTPTDPDGGNGGDGNGRGDGDGRRCRKPDKVKLKGKVDKKGIAKAKLEQRERQLERKLGCARRSKSDHLLFDVKGGGALVVGFRGNDSAFIGTDSDDVKLDGVRAGDSESKAKRKLGSKADRKGRLLLLEQGKATFVVGTGGGDVESVGVADGDLADGKIKKFAKRLS